MKRPLTTLPIVALSVLSLTACGDSVFDVGGLCVAAVNVDGVTFTPGSPPPVAPEDVGAVHLEVAVYAGCQDTPQVAWEESPWHSGTSNFLEVGTRIHRVDGYAPTEMLTHWSDVVDEWLPLVPAIESLQVQGTH